MNNSAALALILTTIINLSVMVGFFTKLESRLTRLETVNEIILKNVKVT